MGLMDALKIAPSTFREVLKDKSKKPLVKPSMKGRKDYHVGVTVCVGAIARSEQGYILVGVADRMITAGATQYEPPVSKISYLTGASVVLVAGDAAVQKEVLELVNSDIDARVRENPKDWIPIKDMADLYSKRYAEVRLKCAERDILFPLGFTRDSIFQEYEFLGTPFGNSLADSFRDYELDYTETIIMGLDYNGPHLFKFSAGMCKDFTEIGFSAIGTGASHAGSQMMSGQFNPGISGEEGILLSLLSKKRAEVSPGVGSETDMVVVGPKLGQRLTLPDLLVDHLESRCNAIISKEKRALKTASAKLSESLKRVAQGNQLSETLNINPIIPPQEE